MTDALIECALETLPLLALVAMLAASRRVSLRPAWLAAAILLIFVHDLLITRFLWQIPFADIEGEWNWLGKLLGLAGMLAIAALPAFGFARSGITIRQRPGSGPAWLLTGFLCLIFLAQALNWDVPTDSNSIAFMWTVPGPEEELFYRGILLLALNEAFAGRTRILGAEMGWAALLTSIQFGAVHGISFAGGEAGFDAPYFLDTFLLALAWVWIREKTGSILAPAISHNVDNGLARLL